MILIAGGTGTLGTRVVRLLRARGRPIRVLTRDRTHAAALFGSDVEIVRGDVRDTASAARALAGVHAVVSAIQGFSGSHGGSPETVDRRGNGNLIRAAREAGAEHFVLISVHGASAEHALDLFRAKYGAEQELRASGLAWTIIRPTASMDTWARLVGEPLLRKRRALIFGRGDNPINFVAADDVARVAARAVDDPGLWGPVLEIGGPENLTFRQFVQTFQAVTGTAGMVRHIPLPLMRALALLLPPVSPTVARQIQAAVVMDTVDMTFDPLEMGLRDPSLAPTRLAEFVEREYGNARHGLPPLSEG